MREIKFRAWDKDRWMYQDEFIISEGICHELVMGGWRERPEIILQQYTGLKDKNGVEIYEGDIVKLTRLDNSYSWIAECVFDIGCVHGKPYTFGFWFSCKDLTLGLLNDFYIEVIGNRLENPDLLK